MSAFFCHDSGICILAHVFSVHLGFCKGGLGGVGAVEYSDEMPECLLYLNELPDYLPYPRFVLIECVCVVSSVPDVSHLSVYVTSSAWVTQGEGRNSICSYFFFVSSTPPSCCCASLIFHRESGSEVPFPAVRDREVECCVATLWHLPTVEHNP